MFAKPHSHGRPAERAVGLGGLVMRGTYAIVPAS